ncbi:hypothetical protein AJ80_01812 [Polytolypa hystricis UAMH7299]|uniref:Uncharacterized protein n=1 Tax=Polytolypa hystricis (strain UAMH7299) TaxID=1447883 RepID=A0A2B7Z040_POLH7|nr:hypothetical protein AJ80_01812 [Polytolypa hystricis UAMH7299]
MLRCAPRSFASPYSTRRVATARYLHRVTADFLNYDAGGNPVSTNVPIIVGNPGETYVLIYPEVALHAGSLLHASTSAISVKHRCKLTFFHDSQHFGFESSSHPRLHILRNIPRQTDSNTSPATLFLTGKMHEVVLDGTPDAQFAEKASATGRDLEHVLDQLKDM